MLVRIKELEESLQKLESKLRDVLKKKPKTSSARRAKFIEQRGLHSEYFATDFLDHSLESPTAKPKLGLSETSLL